MLNLHLDFFSGRCVHVVLQTRFHTTFRPFSASLIKPFLFYPLSALLSFFTLQLFSVTPTFSLILFPLFPLSPYSDSYDYLVLRFSHDPLVQYLRSITRTVVLQFDNYCYYLAIAIILRYTLDTLSHSKVL